VAELKRTVVYLGSYGSGLGVYSRDGARLSHLSTLDTPDPSYLIADPDRPVIYAANELDGGTVSSYAVEPGGTLRPLSTQPTGGALPCHLALHQGHLLAANYGSGSTSVHPIAPDGTLGPRTDLVGHEGGLGPDPHRQEGSHAHQVTVAGDEVTVVDLGCDRLWHHRLDAATGRLSATGSTPTLPGAGPRHAVVHPSGHWYVANELDSTVATFEPDPGGRPRPAGTQPTTSSALDTRNYPSGIVLSRDARFLYVGNRGADSITTFAVTADGSLMMVGEISSGGRWPRQFAIVDDLLFVANQNSHTVVAFRLDPGSGLLRPTGEVTEVDSPSCVLPG
jgi:6-phosphogluconolactonase